MLQSMISQFHWLRPEWLFALIPALLLPLILWRKHASQHGWNKLIDSQFLLQLQAKSPRQQSNKARLSGLALLWTIAVIALAGPSWERQNVPVEQSNDALVMVLDLSLSQLAEDIPPSRIARSRMKMLDILNHRKEGLTGLVVYAGDAHVVTPLTDDTATIAAMMPALGPEIMPSLGSNVASGIQKALQLATQAGVNKPHILLISDGITGADVKQVSDLLSNGAATLAILGVGTVNGGPVKISDEQGLLRNQDGSIAIPKLSRDNFTQLASQLSGNYREISLDDSDWQTLLRPIDPLSLESRESDRQFDAWLDRGAELCLVLIVLALPAFRKGIIFSLVMITPLFFSQPSQANVWDSLWQRPDQQGAKMLENGDAKAAANTFEDPQWQAYARYKDNNFAGANSALKDIDDPIAHYNRGNALAKLGEYQAAIDAYQKTLDVEPDNEDAAFNKALVEKLLEQQNQEQQQQGENEQQQGSNDKSQDAKNNQGDQQSNDPSSQQRNDDQQGEQQDAEQNQEQQQQQNQQQDEQQQNQSGEEQDQSSQASENDAQQADGQPKPFESLSDEEKQTMEQWMRQIPDDPGGLLRRKFRYQYEQRRRSGQEEVPETWY